MSVACEAFSTYALVYSVLWYLSSYPRPQAFEGRTLIDKGSNELSSAENTLSKAYHELGRPDMAAYLTQGKPFQWLSMLVGAGGNLVRYEYSRALGEALGLKMEETMEAFLEVQREKYGGGLPPLAVEEE